VLIGAKSSNYHRHNECATGTAAPPLTETDPSAVARGLEAQFEALSAEPIGWKIGLNVGAVQRQLGLERPVIGHLTSASLIDEGSTHSLEGGVRVGVEPEVAIHLGPNATIEALGAAIEVVDLDPAKTELEAILAGNVFHRGAVLGTPVKGVGAGDLANLTATVTRNGAPAAQAAFAETGTPPAEVVEIVADRLAQVGGSPREGQVIIAGSLTPIVFVEPGDSVEVDLGPLGALALRFA
jgi:2-keto-4-pentenoate hydratase